MDAESGTDGPSVILVAVDGSTTSMRAGAYAAGLARRQGSRLVVGHVVVPPGAAALVLGGAAAVVEAGQQVLADLREEVDKAVAGVGIPAEFRSAQGSPYPELVRMAEEVHAELVVLGASTSPGHRVVGSLGARMIRSGRWPVVVVPWGTNRSDVGSDQPRDCGSACSSAQQSTGPRNEPHTARP